MRSLGSQGKGGMGGGLRDPRSRALGIQERACGGQAASRARASRTSESARGRAQSEAARPPARRIAGRSNDAGELVARFNATGRDARTKGNLATPIGLARLVIGSRASCGRLDKEGGAS